MNEGDESHFVKHIACSACGSSDANSLYSDGHTHCFNCRAYGRPEGAVSSTERKPRMAGLIEGDAAALPKRGIGADACKKFGYRVGQHKGRTVQFADYRDKDGHVVAQHVRDVDKNFSWTGDATQAGLWGKHLWQEGGKRIVVCEGEIDALSVAQSFGLSWPVVSIPNGAQSAKKAIQRDLEYLESFDQVVLCFDADTAGRNAVAECAPLFSPGRCAIAEYPLKDANEVLKTSGVKAVCSGIYQARLYRPGGIMNGSELWERITAKREPGIPYPWPGLTAKTGGQKPGTLITWTSGTGMGKSSCVAQVAYDLAFPKDGRKPQTVGYVALEEDVGMAGQRFLSLHLGKRCHVVGQATEQEMRGAFEETLGTGRVFVYDHFGSTDSDDLMSKLRYLAKGCGCTTLVLDHLSIVVSGMDQEGDERRLIDRTMTMLRTLVEETGVIMHLVSHLKRPSGDVGHEDGARVSLAQLRGSAAIAQLSDQVIGLERNQQAGDGDDKTMGVRVLKNRATGDTGVACRLEYSTVTGVMTEVTEPERGAPDDDSPF